MKMARVVGNVVSTVKNPALEGIKILLIRSIDGGGKEFGKPFVALDAIGAGAGEEVFYVRGKEGAFPFSPHVASDCSIVGILDRYNFEGEAKKGRSESRGSARKSPTGKRRKRS